MKRRNQPRHLEDDLQIACVSWFKFVHKDSIILAIPNGGNRNWLEAYRLKRAGVLAGVSDLFIPEPRHGCHGLWIEMKIGSKKPTRPQLDFMAAMRDRGYDTAICYTFEEFETTVNNYLRRRTHE